MILEDGEVLKLFVPRAKRVVAGRPQDQIITGALMFLPRTKLVPLRPPSKKFEWPVAFVGCEVANFPWLVRLSSPSQGPMDGNFVDGLQALTKSLPDDEAGWQEQFGADVFDMSGQGIIVPLVHFLRDAVPSPRP